MIKLYKKSCKEHDISNCIACAEERQKRKYEKVKANSKELTKKRNESKLSKGETEVARVLDNLNLTYEREKTFSGLYNYNGTTLLYYDFWVPCNNLCIEFDGSQHYSINKTDAEKANDFKKNMYCKKNNINILRIKYTDIDNVAFIIRNKLNSIKNRRFEKYNRLS